MTFPKNVWSKSSQQPNVSLKRQHICLFRLEHVHDNPDYVHLANSISFWICYFFCSFNFLRCFTKKSPFRWSPGFFFLRDLCLVHPDQQGRCVSKEYTFNTNYCSCRASHVQVFQRTNLGVSFVNARAEPSSVVPQLRVNGCCCTFWFLVQAFAKVLTG